MRKFKSFFSILTIIFFLASVLTSCNENFDEPPVEGQDPNIEANISIAALKAKYLGTAVKITEDLVIKGVVIADDRSGNFYKSLVIQDSTAGILIRMDGSSMYTKYPIGRRIFIKCKGLCLGEYSGLIQLGGAIDNTTSPPGVTTIPSAVFDDYILPGVWGINVQPIDVNINDLDNTYQNMLIRINDVQVSDADAGKTYADPIGLSSVNINIEDCAANSIIMRSSGYASFAGKQTPLGKGSVTAVYSVFGTDKQLIIRDYTDLKMDSVRCGGGVISYVGIKSIRDAFVSGSTTAPAGARIKGIVISDRTTNNIVGQNLVIQDSTGGIVLRFSGSHTFSVGDEIEVNVGGIGLSEFNGLLQISTLSNSAATKIGTGTITPRVATIAAISSNFEAWESTLIQISGVTMTGGTGGTYSGNVTLSDGSGTITLFTRSSASFAGNSYPLTPVTVVGYLGQFTSAQVQVRDPLTDVF